MFFLIAILIGVVTNLMGYPIGIADKLGNYRFINTNTLILVLCEAIFACLWHCHMQLQERVKKLENKK